jgi:hypothetical protein
MSKRSKPQTIEYAFRFAKGTDTDQARMVEMIRVNVHELVKHIVFTHQGQPVEVDGFRLREIPEQTYDLGQPIAQQKRETE